MNSELIYQVIQETHEEIERVSREWGVKSYRRLAFRILKELEEKLRKLT